MLKVRGPENSLTGACCIRRLVYLFYPAVLYWLLLCVWSLNYNYIDHLGVTFNLIMVQMDGWLFWCMCSPLCFLSGLLSVPFLFAGRHCKQGAALVGSESLTGAETIELFHTDMFPPTLFISVAVTAGRVQRTWARLISSYTAESNGTKQPMRMSVEGWEGKQWTAKRNVPADMEAMNVHKELQLNEHFSLLF